MSGLIPEIKGAVNAPLINDETAAENDNPYEGKNLEDALEDLRRPEHQSIFDDTSPTVFKGNNSAQVAKSYDLGPGRIPSNKPGTMYSL